MEPPPSEACAAGTRPAATAAAAPPDEPPGEQSRFQGLWQGTLLRQIFAFARFALQRENPQYATTR
jgi:hypothetical protein